MTNAIRRGFAFLLLLAAAKAFAAPGVDAATFLRKGAHRADAVRVTGVKSGDTTLTLDLRRFDVFARNAELRADDGHGHVQRLPRPRTRYYAGRVEETGAAVFLAVEEDGRARGIVDRDGTAASLDADAAHGLRLVPIDTSAPRTDGGFRCSSDELDQARAIVEKAQAAVPAPTTTQPSGPGKRPYRARVAIETDYQYFQKFTTAAQAAAYAGDLIAYASTKYLTEIDTRLEIVFLRLWTTADDPWVETSSNCSLYELGLYWNTHMTGVSRSIVHMLSARTTGGGVAWIGGLCRAPFSSSASGCTFGTGMRAIGGDYGFTGNLRANFVPGNPQVLWDSYAPAHEIGHNFNSPHTHCYNGIGGSADPIDMCHNADIGCYSGTRTLPGPTGQGSGTIMSYCHLITPGFANISMSFGTSHPYGVAPERVPARMSDYVANLAQSDPDCVVDDTLFADGFD
jgi:hypothetical protein